MNEQTSTVATLCVGTLQPVAKRRGVRQRTHLSPGPLLALPALLLLAACGSGSGDSTDSLPASGPLDPLDVGAPASVPADDEPGTTTADVPELVATPPVELTPQAPPDVPPEDEPPAIPPTGLVPRVDVVDLDGLYAYRRDSRYADVLADCALIERALDGCSLQTLPFIAQETNDPSVEDVMERLLVTHDWMGERFELILRNRPAELLPLFGAVTSVVIGSTVRPSNYWTGTGGIQLDPAGLWLSVEEKANISVQEDFRAPFRSLLSFRNLWNIYVEGQSIFGRFGLEDRSVRTFNDIELPTMSLLFHELAHANDFFPPGTASLLNTDVPPAVALNDLSPLWLSRSLDIRLPLNSRLLTDLAGVRFRGETPTDELQVVSGTVAGAEMASDGGTHFYSYSTIREDFANLYEAVQMKRVYNADLHIAYVTQPENPEQFDCGDLLVEWGVLNRLGNPMVRNRANDVTQSISGADPDIDRFLESLEGTETSMEVGVDWCTNLDRAGPSIAATARSRSHVPAATMQTMPAQTHDDRHAIMDPLQGTR